MTVPLGIRLKTARADKHITRDVRGVKFRSSIPGGFASCTISLNRPLTILPDEIDYYASLYVYDLRTGATVWEGRVEDLGRTVGRDGQVWALSAIGPSAHTRDRTVPLIYVDTDLSALKRYNVNLVAATDGVKEDPGGTGKQGLVLHYPQGCTSFVGAEIRMRYNRILDANQHLARVNYQWRAGGTDTNFSVHFMVGTGGSLTETPRTQTLIPSSGFDPKVVVTDWTNGRDTLDFHHENAGPGSGLVPNDGFWASLLDISIRAMLYSAAGTELTTGYTADTVLASEIAADLVGRLLPLYDGAGASITTTSYTIDRLAYPDGTTAFKVLADLMTFEPGYYWAAWESNQAGKYRFEWSAWPSTVRYEADSADGFDSPGSADDLYNAVRVRYRDVNGEIKTVQRTLAVAALTNAGITREAFLDLGDEVGSLTAAQRAGDQYLVEHAYPPNAGRLQVSGPIIDNATGRMVMPWEIRPGHLIRVRGVLPRVDALNATTRDGVTTFRIVSVDFDAGTGTATLGLDSQPLSVSQAVADLQQQQPSKGPRRRR
jgi:hypothetical protein